MTTRIRSLQEKPTFLVLTSLTLLVLSIDALSAQSNPAEPAGEIGALYARIRYLEGPILVIGDEGERSGDLLGVNAPILPRDGILTREGRVEVQLADGSLLRLGRHSRLEARVLSDLANQLESRTWFLQSAGRTYLYVEGIGDGDEVFRLDTPTTSIYFLTRGIFRIDVAEGDGSTVVSSHSGVAEVVAEGVSVLVRSGDRSMVLPRQRPSDTRPFNPYARDDFDLWNQERQAAYVKGYESLPTAELAPEIRPYVTELSYYGEWVHEPTYGWVWRPPAAGPDWSPYLVGRWHSAPAGWLWVSYEAWGWAPYHYGRWEYHVSMGWIWIPGRVFSGAWVSWAWSPGYLGWCPLNYYNRPVVHVHKYATHRHRSWIFVPQDRIHGADLRRVAVPKARLEPVAAAARLINRAPRVQPRQVATASPRSGPPGGTRAVPDAAVDDGALVSFRTLEGGGRSRTEPTTPTATPSTTAAPATRSVDFRPGTALRTPVSQGGSSVTRGAGTAATAADQEQPRPSIRSRSAADDRPLNAIPGPADDGRAPASRITRQPDDSVPPATEPATSATKTEEPRPPRVRVIELDQRGDLLDRIFQKEPAPATPTVARPSPAATTQTPPPPEPRATATDSGKQEPARSTAPHRREAAKNPPPKKQPPKKDPPKKATKKDDGRH